MTTDQPDAPVGVVGVGAMGSVIARHLATSGRRVVAWDRNPAASAVLAGAGIAAAADLAGLADCDVVLNVVFDDEATRAVTFGPGRLLDVLRPGAVHVAMASITPALARELADAHAARGQAYLSASMFGRPEAAEAAQLLLNCSGDAAAFARAKPLLAVLGTVRWLGAGADKAMLVKAMGNAMITAAGEMVREMFSGLAASGIDGSLCKELLIDSLFRGPIFDGGARRYMADPTLPRMTPIARKDRDTCLAAVAALGIELPLLRFLAERDLP